MPEYLSPGVYVEEVEMGAKPIAGVSTSTAGFLGETERGPTDPELVTSFAEFKRVYGGFVPDTYLAYAVDGFFRNGGQRCYVGRVVPTGWVTAANATASATLDDGDEDDGPTDLVDVSAVGPGPWGNNVVLRIGDATLPDDSLFSLTVGYWSEMEEVGDDPDYDTISDPDNSGSPDIEETYDNLSANESSSGYYEKRVTGVSTLVELEQSEAGRPANGTVVLSGSPADTAVDTSDYEGNDAVGARTGLAAFKQVDDISLVVAPDENAHAGLTGSLVSHCANMGDRFAILQADQSADTDALPPQTAISDYAAIYYPWIKVRDPETNVLTLVPPAGHVAGVYARSDTERGVHKAPANETIRGVQELEVNVTKGDQDVLNPKGVNCLRSFRGRGIRVWGARTTSSDPLWRYVNVRRLFLYLEESIDEGTQWVVFEPNNERLWARVRQTVSNFLTTVWRDGALMGTTPDQAFFVKCDRSTMTQDDIDNGRLVCEIGVAPTKPAEFVVFRIAQWTGGAEGG